MEQTSTPYNLNGILGNIPLTADPDDTVLLILFTDRQPTANWPADALTISSFLRDQGLVIATVYDSDVDATTTRLASSDSLVFTRDMFNEEPYSDVIIRRLCIGTQYKLQAISHLTFVVFLQ